MRPEAQVHDADWDEMGRAIRDRYTTGPEAVVGLTTITFEDAPMALFVCLCGHRSPIWRQPQHWQRSAANHYRTVISDLQALIAELRDQGEEYP